MTDRELMQQALEVLTHLQPTALNSFYTIGNRDKAIKALRERLAQSDQEPAAWNWMQEGEPCSPAYYGKPPDSDIEELALRNGKTVRLLYTTPQPRRWQGLTDEDYTELSRNFAVNRYQSKAIEAKLREKNT